MADLATAPALTLRRATWAEIEAPIGVLDNPECSLEWYRRQVAGGGLHALAVESAERIVAGVLVRIEPADWGMEFVIVAASGGARGRDLVAEVIPQLESLAALMQCGSVRFHTSRAGLGEKAERAGYAGVETVYRKRLG
jgi:hypothetical protein